MMAEPLRTRRDYGASDGINPHLNVPPTVLKRRIEKESDPKKKKEMAEALNDWRITTPGPFWKTQSASLEEKNMDKVLVAKKLVKLAQAIMAEEAKAVSATMKEASKKTNAKEVLATKAADASLEKQDSSMSALAQKVADVTEGDFSKMLTLVVMAMKKGGHAEEANKIFQLFKMVDKKVQTASDDSKKKVASDVKEKGGPYKVDMKVVKQFDSSPPYVRLVQKEIKMGDRAVDVHSIDGDKAEIFGFDTNTWILGGVWVPVSALSKA